MTDAAPKPKSLGDQLSVFVPGIPKGQPRPRAFALRGKARMFDPGTAEGWKGAIAAAIEPILPDERPCWDGPVTLHATFYFPRPRGHYGSGKNAGVLKGSAPRWHTSKPDIDNALKAVMDCLTTLRLWRDDAQVDTLSVKRQWAGEQGPGMSLTACIWRGVK